MKIETTPCCRVGWEGATLDYKVSAKGATEIVAPDNEMPGVRVRVVDSRPTADGVEARVQVEVVDSSLV